MKVVQATLLVPGLSEPQWSSGGGGTAHPAGATMLCQRGHNRSPVSQR